MTVHRLIGSELLAFEAALPKGQFISNLIHHPAGVYTAYVIDRNKQPELFQSNENETINRMDGNHQSTALG
jgi:hypothetical protein